MSIVLLPLCQCWKKCIYFLKEFSSSLQWMVTKLRKIKNGRREFGNPHYWIFYWPPLTKAQKICQISHIYHFSTITIFAHMFIHHSLTLPSCMHTTKPSDLVNVNNFTQRQKSPILAWCRWIRTVNLKELTFLVTKDFPMNFSQKLYFWKMQCTQVLFKIPMRCLFGKLERSLQWKLFESSLFPPLFPTR